MGRRASGSQNSLVAGATTVLVAIVAVLLAYNANAGLPFVPVYELNAELPDAANLVTGAEVRAGGTRVGQVSKIEPVPHSDRAPTARVTLALDKSLEPLRTSSKVVVRSRSALGLKYVELAAGATGHDLPAGSKLEIRQASPRPVELDQVLDTFDERTREGARRTLDGLGSGLAGRGAGLNSAIAALPPLLSDLEPVAANLSDRETRIDRLVSALGTTTDELAPVSEVQARMFVNLDTTFAALAEVARPSLQQRGRAADGRRRARARPGSARSPPPPRRPGRRRPGPRRAAARPGPRGARHPGRAPGAGPPAAGCRSGGCGRARPPPRRGPRS
jgi:virulence factor Mce-like protein